MSAIRAWLEALDLGEYADSFEEEQVLREDLCELTSDDLKEMGLPVGPRKRVLKAARGDESGSAPSSPLAPERHTPSRVEVDAAVAAAASVSPDANAQQVKNGTSEGERRQLTVMFCDLVDSTALADRLDPEDLRNVVRAYQDTAAAVINRYEGHIAQYLGDGLLVYFGHPVAHEDDAQRAVLAGLEIIEEIAALNKGPQGEQRVQLALRLGIHTGVVVLGAMGGGEQHGHLALGDTPNIAARLQGLAAPDTIVISGATARLVESTFALEELGAQTLKGVAEPMMAARVLEPRALSSEADEGTVLEGRFLIGRDEEVGLLRRHWEQSIEGSGQVVVLTGEAGIGKSALVETLYGTVAESDAVRVIFRCSPYHRNSALYPIIKHLQRVMRFEREDSPTTKFEKLEQLLKGYQFTADDTVPLFAALLSVPLPEGRYPSLTLSPQQQRQNTHDALVAWLTEETERTPVLVVFEDLHWADASTIEMVGVLVEEVPTVRVLMVLTARLEFVPPWPPRSHLTPLTLNRLERPQVAALVTYLAGDKALPEDVIQHVVSKTDGVPLFVEELTKTLLESNVLKAVDNHYQLTGPLEHLIIPSTLHDSLMARLDRLPESKEVAQLGAVLGREFAYEMVKALTTEVDEVLQAHLGALVDAELLYQRGRPPHSKYTFKHALIQDAAYSSLLRGTRQAYHRAAAEMLELQFPDLVEKEPELVANHYAEAGLSARAIPYWLKAGEHAAQRSANVEAASHFATAIDHLPALPHTHERDRQELELQMALGTAQMVNEGYAAEDVGRAYDRAYALCLELGDGTETGEVLLGLWAFHFSGLQLEKSQAIAEQLLRIAQSNADPSTRMNAHVCMAATLHFLGKFADARDHEEQSISVSNTTPKIKSTTPITGVDFTIAAPTWHAMSTWLLGYPDQAMESATAALNLATKFSHPFTSAYAHDVMSMLRKFRGEVQMAFEHAEAAAKLSTEHGFVIWGAWANILRAATGSGLSEVQVREGNEAIEILRHSGTVMFLTYYRAVVAEILIEAGLTGDAVALLDQAIETTRNGGEVWYEAELYRLKGEAVFRSSTDLSNLFSPQQAEICFIKAIEIAHKQGAKSLELRATTNLVQLQLQQGDHGEAAGLLSAIASWFPEGFDTHDLRHANALLADLQ